MADIDKVQKRFERRNRATTGTLVAMLIVAIAYDLARAAAEGLDLVLPPLGSWLSGLIGIYAWLTFYVWTSIKGWGLSDTVKQWIVQWLLPAIGEIPIIGGISFVYTIKVLLNYFFLRAEDAIYNATKGKADVRALERAAEHPAIALERYRRQRAIVKKKSSRPLLEKDNDNQGAA